MIDTRNVLLKCRNPVRSMLRYDAAAGHVVLLECHHSFSAFSDSGCTTVRSRVVSFLGGQNIHVVNLQVPGSNIAMDWLIQHPTDQYIHQKCRKYIHLCLRFFFCPIYAYFLRITLSISLPFVTHIRGHMARTPFPSPLLCVPSF